MVTTRPAHVLLVTSSGTRTNCDTDVIYKDLHMLIVRGMNTKTNTQEATMIHHIEIDYSKRSSPGTLTIICSARGRILYQARWIHA